LDGCRKEDGDRYPPSIREAADKLRALAAKAAAPWNKIYQEAADAVLEEWEHRQRTGGAVFF
jgi:hypothetical protein